MPKTTCFRKILLLTLLVCTLMTVTCAYTVNFYNGETLASTKTGTDGEPLIIESDIVRDGRYLLGWEHHAAGLLHGYRIVPSGTWNLHSVWIDANKALPGQNAFENGDFEGEGLAVRPSNGSFRIITEADGNRALEYVRGSGYASLQRYIGWEAGRKYRVSYRVKTPAVTSSMYNPRYITETNTSSDHPTGAKTTAAGEWVSFATDFTIPADHKPSAAHDFLSLYCNPMSGAGGTVYYDDLVLIPWVRVSYHAEGGSGAPENEYILDGTYAVSGAVPARRGFLFAGWSLSAGSAETVTTVDITGGDIDLYAVWEPVSAQNAVTWQFDNDRPGSADGTVTVIAPEEALDYTGATLLFADADGILSDYTPLAALTLTDGAAAYSMSGGRAFPKEATRLCVRFTAPDKADLPYWYDIPAEKRLDKTETPLFTFYALSDLHLSDYWPEMTVNRARAVADIRANKPDFVTLGGDLVNQGETALYQKLDAFLKTSFNDAGIPAFIAGGNHEFYISDKNSLNYDRAALLASFDSQIAALRGMGCDIRRDGDSLWYSAVIGDRKFIFLSAPTAPQAGMLASYTLTDAQLDFLEAELYDGEKSGRTAFVVSHVPLSGYVPNSSDSIANSAAVKEILNRHPNTVFITGHTHSNLSLDLPFVKVGNMSDTFTHLNDGCAVWLEDGSSKYGPYEVAFSAGQVLEVYKDKILIKARKFDETCVFFGHGLYLAEIPGAEASLPDVTISGGRPEKGVTLTAVLTGDDADNPLLGFEWLIRGRVIGTGRSVTITDLKPDDAGQHVVLRVTDEKGHFACARSTAPFAGVTLHYDSGSGTGSVPADKQVIDGMDVPLETAGNMPRKDGAFFVGWADTPDAAAPLPAVRMNGDTTVYAVYSEKPFFGFDTTLCGWSPNSAVKDYAISDGALNVSADPKDMYFTLSNIAIDAAASPIMRVKVRYDSGSGDGMFFSIKDGGGFSQSNRIPLASGTKIAEIDGYDLVEYDLTALPGVKDNWKGTVNALRYDVLGSGGSGAVDYISFTDKKAVLSAELTVQNPVFAENPSEKAPTLSGNSTHCRIVGFKWQVSEQHLYLLTVTLAPDEGYEFTSNEDVAALATVNGVRPYNAVIDPQSGYAEVSAYIAPVFPLDNGENVPTLRQVKIPGIPENGYTSELTVIIALYNAEGRIVKTIARDAALPSVLYLSDTGTNTRVRVFLINNRQTLSPFCEEPTVGITLSARKGDELIP